MDVFVGNLSPRTTLGDLVTFFKSFSSSARFQIFDKQFDDGNTTRYAVASIEPDKLAEKVIKKLSGMSLNGSRVVLREFNHRNYGNERRAMGWRDKIWQGEERRKNERRRKIAAPDSGFDWDKSVKAALNNDEVDLDNVQVEARDIFSRKG